MRILVDTNVLLYELTGRQPYFDNADRIIKLCADKKVFGYMAAHSIPNMFYILRKDMPEDSRREALLNLCEIFTVEGVDSSKIIAALKNVEFQDMEDCLQERCAVSVKADYIVTRNIKDFEFAAVPAVLPEQFLELMDKKDVE